MTIQINFQPQQGWLDYLVDNGIASWDGYGGSRGGAKSGAIRRIQVKRRLKYPKTNGLIMRRVWDDVEKNHVNKMWEEFPDLFPYYNKASKVINFPEKLGGGKIFFDGAETAIDVKRKAFGPEYFDVCVDQAEQFTEDELNQLKTICRWPGYPENTCKFILTFNPGGVGAAFLQRIFSLKEYHEREKPEDYAFIQAYGWDNVEWARAALASDGYTGDCLGKKCGKCGSCVYYSWDSEARFNYYITRTQYGQEQNALPAHMRAGQLMGDFEKFAGQYFSNFNRSVHVWPLADIIFKDHWPVWGSLDWGYSHSSVFYWHTQAGYVDDQGNSKRLVITFREYTTDHLSERALAEQIVSKNNGLKLTGIWGGHDLWEENTNGETKEQAMSKVFRMHGLPALRKANVSRVDGWRFMHRALDEGEWILTENCVHAVRAIPSLIYNEKPDKEEDILKTRTLYDDAADSLRYGLYSQYSVKDMPQDEKDRIRASHVADPTSRNIMIMKLQADRNKALNNYGVVNSRSLAKYRRYGT